jgi:hypothetical protein
VDPTVSSTGDLADALSGLTCADLVDAMGRGSCPAVWCSSTPL